MRAVGFKDGTLVGALDTFVLGDLTATGFADRRAGGLDGLKVTKDDGVRVGLAFVGALVLATVSGFAVDLLDVGARVGDFGEIALVGALVLVTGFSGFGVDLLRVGFLVGLVGNRVGRLDGDVGDAEIGLLDGSTVG